MRNTRKIFVVGRSTGYANWMQGTLVNDIEDADLVVFTGGEDINPKLYNEPVGEYTSYNRQRDAYEVEYFKKAVSLQKPMIGICRGAQLGCALAGGRLIQHQDNPAFVHGMFTDDGRKLEITSLHHQALFPYEMPEDSYKVLAWTEGASKFHLDGENKEISDKPFKEIEVAYFPKVNMLGIQGHPEMMWETRKYDKETFDYLHDLLDKQLDNKL